MVAGKVRRRAAAVAPAASGRQERAASEQHAVERADLGCEARSGATIRRFDTVQARCAAFRRRRDARTVWQLACWHERAAQEQRSAVGARIAALLRRLWACSAGYAQSGAARADPLAWSGTRALARWSLCAGAERRFCARRAPQPSYRVFLLQFARFLILCTLLPHGTTGTVLSLRM